MINFPPIEGTVLGVVCPTTLPDDLETYLVRLGYPSQRIKRLEWQKKWHANKKQQRRQNA